MSSDTAFAGVNPQWRVVALIATVLAVVGAVATFGLLQGSGRDPLVVLTRSFGAAVVVLLVPAALAWWKREHAPFILLLGAVTMFGFWVIGMQSGETKLMGSSGSTSGVERAIVDPFTVPEQQPNPLVSISAVPASVAVTQQEADQEQVDPAFEGEVVLFKQRADTQAILTEPLSTAMLNANLRIVHDQHPEWPPKDKLNEAFNRTVTAITARETARWDADMRVFSQANCTLVHKRNVPLMDELLRQVVLPGMTNQQLLSRVRAAAYSSEGLVPIRCQ